MQEHLLTVTEAASRVGLRHAALRRAIQRGEIPAVKLCGRVRIRPDDLEEWISRNSIVKSARSTRAQMTRRTKPRARQTL